MKSCLINCDTMEMVKMVEEPDALARLEHWAEILIPKDEFYICDLTEYSFRHFTQLEFNILYASLGCQPKPLSNFEDRAKALTLLLRAAEQFDIDETPLSSLKKKATLPAIEHGTTARRIPMATEKEKAPKDIKNGITRPAGKVSAKIWSIADAIYAAKKEIPSRAQVVAKTDKAGINPATASTQLARWKQYNGLVTA